MIAEVIQGVSKSGDVEEEQGEEEALALRAIVHVRLAESELVDEGHAKARENRTVAPTKRSDHLAQLDAKEGNNNDEVQGGNDYEMKMEGVDADMLEHIEAQLLSANPIFIQYGQTVFHQAAEQGLGGVVARLLVACPFLINVPGRFNGWTPFHCAASADHPAIVAQLLAVNPALINARANDGSTGLHLAAKDGAAAVVAQLLAINPALIDARTDQGEMALHFAAENGHAAIVAQLLAANPAAIEARTDDGWTALHMAARASYQEIVTQLLAANPALIDARTNDGWTALQCAFGGLEKIQIGAQLLAAKPSLIEDIINDDDSRTALLNVVKVDHEEAVSRLLTMHPELIHDTTSHNCGWTVFHEAAYVGSNKVMSLLLTTVPRPDLEQLLLRKSTDRSGGETALHVAARQGNSNMVAQLLAAFPSLVDVLDSEGQTCLHSAVSRNERSESMPTVEEVLLAFKPALIHAVDAQGNTTLHLICRRSSRESIEKLWKLNPDALHAVNRDGKTPFYYAVVYSTHEVTDVLQWSVAIDELVRADNTYGQTFIGEERFKPLIKAQCEELAVNLLPDLVAIVFEYVGFNEGMSLEL